MRRPARKARAATRDRRRDDRAHVVGRLQALRRLARELRREASAPVVERVSQIIEAECHLALWALGDIRSAVPEAGPRR